MDKKLPVPATVLAAFELCRTHLAYALKIVLPWFVILLIVPYFLGGPPAENPAGPWNDVLQPWELLLSFLYVVGWGSIAVLWHQRILRNDHRNSQAMTFDQRVWHYLLRGLLISVIFGIVAVLSMIPAIAMLTLLGGFSSESLSFFIFAPPILVAAGYIAARLSISLPAIALGVYEFGLSRAWSATADNGLRLMIVTALPLVPIFLLAWVLEAIGIVGADLYATSIPTIVMHVVFQFLDFAFGLLGLTVLSLTYAFFAENKEAKGVLGFA